MDNIIKIDNKYVKAEIKGEEQVIFKIAKAITKICEETGEKKDKKNHKNILLKIPDVKELRYIAQKFYIWGFIFAGNFINPSKVKEETIIDEFEWDWKNDRNKAWGLEGDTERVYRLLNNYSKNHGTELNKGSE